MTSCNSWQYLVTILAKIFPRSWQDLAKILLRYPWRVDPGPFKTAPTTNYSNVIPASVVTLKAATEQRKIQHLTD